MEEEQKDEEKKGEEEDDDDEEEEDHGKLRWQGTFVYIFIFGTYFL